MAGIPGRVALLGRRREQCGWVGQHSIHGVNGCTARGGVETETRDSEVRRRVPASQHALHELTSGPRRDLARFTPDIAALADRGMACERLDQLALEHLYGVR